MSASDEARDNAAAPNLERYAPRNALEWLTADAQARHCSVEGTLGFFDLSGFTRIAERLGRAGKAGSETVSAIVDRLYDGIIGPVVSQDGDVLQFSGDAILVLFTGPGHVGRAAVAANDMQRFIAQEGRVETEIGAIRMRMSVGMHTGRCELALIGHDQLYLLAFGPDVSQTCRLEQLAQSGEVLVSDRLAAALPAVATKPARGGAHALLRRAAIPVEVPRRTPAGIDARLAARFVPPDLRVATFRTHAAAGHRPLTTAFVGVRGLDELVATVGASAAADRLWALADLLGRTVDELDVTWTSTDALIDGCHFMITSGLVRIHEDDDDRMLLLARRMVEADLGLRIAVGLNRGRVFVGDAGHAQRRVFTAFGDAINLAARVMNHADDGEVLATPSVLARTRLPFYIALREPFRAKGKSALVAVSAVGHAIDAPSPVAVGGTDPSFVGRDRELAGIRDSMDAARRGEGGVVEIIGEAGMGKSRLLAEARAADDGARWWHIAADAYSGSTPYRAFRNSIRRLIDTTSDADRRAAGAALVTWIATYAPDLTPWVPLLALVIDGEVTPTPEVERLAPDFVRQRLNATVATMLGATGAASAVTVVEDAHWLDDASLDLLRYLCARAPESGKLWLVTRRPAPELGLDDQVTCSLRLEPLDRSETRALAIAASGADPLPTDRLTGIVDRAEGNPFFAVELALAASSRDELPDSVERVTAARLDMLPFAARALLRDASVLGTAVDLALLADARGEPCDDADERWPPLDEFLEPPEYGVRLFRHELFRRAAYEGLPYRRRRELHGRVAAALERLTAPDDREEAAATLALHFHAAREFPRSWEWSRRAGDAARAKSAYYEAANHYARALEAARRVSVVAPSDVAYVAEDLGDVCNRLGRPDDARSAYAIVRELMRDAPIATARALWKTARVQTQQGEYPQSLRTITRGLHVLDDAPPGRASAVERARLLLGYAETRYYQGRLRQAITYGEEAIAAAQLARDDAALAQAHLQLQLFYSDAGDPRNEEHGQEAFRLFTELEDDVGLGNLLMNRGVDAGTGTDWDLALEHFAKSAAAFERAGHEVAAWTAHNNLSEILTDQGHYAEAREVLVEARRVFAAAGWRYGVAITTSGLSRIELRLGNLDEAERLNETALDLFTELGSTAYVLETRVRRIEWLVFARRPAEALALADDLAAQLAHEEASSGPVGNLSITLDRFRSWALLQTARFDTARASALAVLGAARGAAVVLEEAMALITLALIDECEGVEDSEYERAAQALLARLHVVARPAIPRPAP